MSRLRYVRWLAVLACLALTQPGAAQIIPGSPFQGGGPPWCVEALARGQHIVTCPPYNAVGNGVVDDTAAIQAAINAANLAGPNPGVGAEVFVPSGFYKITSTLDLGIRAITLVGAGPGTARGLGHGASVLEVTGAITGLQWGISNAQGAFTGPTIRDLMIRGDAGGNGVRGIHLLAPATFFIENVAVSNFPAGTGIYIDSSGQAADLTTYGSIIEARILFCLVGIDAVHANGVRVISGWISPEGNSTTATPQASSVGVRVQSGDGWQINGTRVQYADRCIDLQGSPTSQHSVVGTRTEGCNTHIRVNSNRNALLLGGMAGGAVGAGDIGVLLDTGSNLNSVVLGGVSGITTPISDLGGTNWHTNIQEVTGAAATGAPYISSAFVEGLERADPAAPAVNRGRLYFKDNGAGKTQLVVRFNTGIVQVIATEP